MFILHFLLYLNKVYVTVISSNLMALEFAIKMFASYGSKVHLYVVFRRHCGLGCCYRRRRQVDDK